MTKSKINTKLIMQSMYIFTYKLGLPATTSPIIKNVQQGALKNMNIVLSGEYVDFLSTGSLPPDGAGLFYFKRVFGDKIIIASYSS